VNAHSCPLTKVRGRGGKGSAIPATVTLHPCFFMQWVILGFFLYIYKILLILNIALKGCFLQRVFRITDYRGNKNYSKNTIMK